MLSDVANPSDPVPAVRAALTAIRREVARAVAVVVAAPDLDTALAAVNELTEGLRLLFVDVAKLRTEIVGRIWEAERLSLAGLAKRVGVTRSRAQQLVDNVKKSREPEL